MDRKDTKRRGSRKSSPPPPPPGYPTIEKPPEKACFPTTTKSKGERTFIEGCLAGLCCCWLCETCCP